MGYTTAEAVTIPFMLAIIVLVGMILGYTLRNKSRQIREIPLQAIAILILVLEVVKQAYLLITGTWTPWAIPMHFCSFFLIWFAFALFSRGTVHQLAYSCCLTGGILVTLMLIFMPRSIVNVACENIFATFSTFHTFVFHFSVVAYWVWLVMLRVYEPQSRFIWQTTVLYFGFFLLVIAAAFIFNTNYTNVLSSDIPPLENIRLSAGQFVYDLVMLLGGTALIAGVNAAIYGLYHLPHRSKTTSK